jgi:hypothetical protein
MPHNQIRMTSSASNKLFLKSIEQLRADIRIIGAKDEFLSTGTGAGKNFRRQAWFRLIVQTCMSFALLAAGLYILLSGQFGEDTKKVGSGFIGTVIGYWLR